MIIYTIKTYQVIKITCTTISRLWVSHFINRKFICLLLFPYEIMLLKCIIKYLICSDRDQYPIDLLTDSIIQILILVRLFTQFDQDTLVINRTKFELLGNAIWFCILSEYIVTVWHKKKTQALDFSELERQKFTNATAHYKEFQDNYLNNFCRQNYKCNIYLTEYKMQKMF